ncbi:GGDEF domain-containing protein [Xanthobacter autotrophicus]|uniref:GGDEF domain-containing protein n=1 Tax=Xanthobacter autotrophicus TaxID=280 RepID=UPI001E5E26E8|nr:GGDEF domain-containing protein [Xanthobacter autotrophicus]UDQ87960.1 GGDEF domain-containing protein [Xanthobacter autotrophicus]
MTDATFLLLINCAIGLTFAAAFLAISRRSSVRLGRWCAAAFAGAAATVLIEALAPDIPSVRLASTLSFGSLMAAVFFIAAGMLRHYRPDSRLGWPGAAALLAVAFTGLAGVDLPRGGWAQALTYQLPFAAMLAFAAGTVLRHSPGRAVDLVLAGVLGLCALQFTAKAVLIPLDGADNGVRDYLTSAYARYSQTAGSILSLMLGVALLALVVTEVIAEATGRLERDGLSGVLTRTAFLERAERLADAAPPGTDIGLLICDLDHFKAINDRFGHSAGDEVIRRFGAVLASCAGPADLCGRIGGEEFCLLMPAANAASLLRVAQRLREATEHLSWPGLPPGHRVTTSLGAALAASGEPLATAMRRADMALYRAKAEGRNRVQLAEG